MGKKLGYPQGIAQILLRPPGLPSGKIPDGIFLQAGLAVLAFRSAQTKTTLRFSHLVTHQAVGAFGRKKPPLKAVLRTAPTRNLATSRLVDPRRSRPRLAMLAFRTRVARTQTRIRLRLSSPGRGQSSLPAWAKN